MSLLKHNNYEFRKLLAGGYSIKEDEPNILLEKTMADGSIRRNYGNMPKTYIEVKFSQLNKNEFQEILSHFNLNEDYYTYFSPKNQSLLTKKFFVEVNPEVLLSSTGNHRYDELTVKLTQCGVYAE